MNKERLVNFNDGVIAIIITILILALDKPTTPTFEAIWAIRIPLLSYLISFAFVASVWLSQYYTWIRVERVNLPIIIADMFVLFFLSILPYATDLTQNHFFSLAPQILYGILTVCITLSGIVLNLAIERENPNQFADIGKHEFYKRIIIDLGIKGIGFILAIFVWPPFMMFSITLTAILLSIPVLRDLKKVTEKKAVQ